MPTTPQYGLPWPLSTDTPDVPRDIQNLAEATEAAIVTATAGHARGNFPSQSIPHNVLTNPANSVSSLEGITHGAGVFTLNQPGFYAVAANFGFATAPGRIGLIIQAPLETGTGQTDFRYSATDPETLIASSAVCYSDGTGQVQFRIYQAAGASVTGNGLFMISYLGA